MLSEYIISYKKDIEPRLFSSFVNSTQNIFLFLQPYIYIYEKWLTYLQVKQQRGLYGNLYALNNRQSQYLYSHQTENYDLYTLSLVKYPFSRLSFVSYLNSTVLMQSLNSYINMTFSLCYLYLTVLPVFHFETKVRRKSLKLKYR